MLQLIEKVKSLRTDISDVVTVLVPESTENPSRSIDLAIGSLIDAFMFLGKNLSYLGVPNPYEGKELTKVVDWTEADYKIPEDSIAIHVVKKARLDIQKLIANNAFNHLLDLSTDAGQSNVKFNDRQWFITMTILTDLMKAKMWLGMYLKELYLAESDEQKDERLAVERKEEEKVDDKEVTSAAGRQITVDDMKAFLTEKGIKFNKNLGEKKIAVLYNENQ